MKGLYKVGDIVNVKTVLVQLHAKPIHNIRGIYYVVEGFPYLEHEIEPTNETWQPEMNVTAKSSHIPEAAVSKVANDAIQTMIKG